MQCECCLPAEGCRRRRGTVPFTAEIMTTLLGVEIPVNRQMFRQQPGQQALVFKLNGRPEEGKILTADEIQEIGYRFQLLVRLD